jgi:hypothetical protein
MGDGHRLFLQHGHFVFAEAEHEVAVADRLELVEGIHQPEQIERDDIEGIDGKRRVERRARGGLVARAQQMDAEVGGTCGSSA